MADEIVLKGLRAWTRVGASAAERICEQQVEIDVSIVPRRELTNLNDDLSLTLDYDGVRRIALEQAGMRARALIETLAQDILVQIAATTAAAEVSVAVRKFIYPDAEWVGVIIRRTVELESA